MNFRCALWFVTVCVSVAGCLTYSLLTEQFDTPSHGRVWLFALIGFTGLALVFLSPLIQSRRAVVGLIWLPAVAMRVALLPTAPSDDINRYLWEGRLVAEGLSPYEAVADSERWLAYRDDYWAAMNHKDKPTAYPPLTELAFSWVVRVAYHPIAFKIVFIGADLLVLGGVLCLLKKRGLTQAFAGLYAFNPVVLISFAGEAHFDVLMLAALVWAGVAWVHGRPGWAVALASVASGIKWVTLPLIPFFAGKRLVRGAVISLTVLILPSLYFWSRLPELWRGLFEFGATRSFNGPIYGLLQAAGLSRIICGLLVASLFGGVLLWRWLSRERAAFDGHVRWILGSLVVLSPTVHLWYLTWLLPFVCLRPSLPWLLFSLSGGAYFYVWLNADMGVWGLEPWQQTVFWLPFALGCLYEVWSTRGRVIWPVLPKKKSGDMSLAVVIPTLNIEDRIQDALRSVRAQTRPADAVYLVDSGSTDGTVAQAMAAFPDARVVDSDLGRGQQIARGIETATEADWVVVLHADAVLPSNALEQIAAAVEGQPDIVGGALGQRFEGADPELLPIELLNDLRGVFTRTAFGDQTQFFHRETAIAGQLMPKQPLMEDVESSWRVRECGGFVFLGQPGQVCHRKWKARAWLKRFLLVMRLVTRYRAARLTSRVSAMRLSEEMYREYYGCRK